MKQVHDNYALQSNFLHHKEAILPLTQPTPTTPPLHGQVNSATCISLKIWDKNIGGRYLVRSHRISRARAGRAKAPSQMLRTDTVFKPSQPTAYPTGPGTLQQRISRLHQWATSSARL